MNNGFFLHRLALCSLIINSENISGHKKPYLIDHRAVGELVIVNDKTNGDGDKSNMISVIATLTSVIDMKSIVRNTVRSLRWHRKKQRSRALELLHFSDIYM